MSDSETERRLVSFRAGSHASSLRAGTDPLHHWTDSCGSSSSNPRGTVHDLRPPTNQRTLNPAQCVRTGRRGSNGKGVESHGDCWL